MIIYHWLAHLPPENQKFNYDFIFEIIKWITPVVLFFLGYFLNEFIKRRNRTKELQKLKKYFIALLTTFIKNKNSQIEQNLDCIKRLKDYNTNDIKLNKVASNSIKRINDIKFDDLFEIFVTSKMSKSSNKDRIKEFYNLNNDIDFIEASIPLLFESNIETISNFTNIINQWNTTFQRIIDFRNKAVTDYNVKIDNGIKDNFAKGVIEIYDDYMKLPQNEIDNFYNTRHKLIEPLIKHIKLFSKDHRSNILMQYCAMIDILYKTVIDQRRQHRSFLILSSRGLLKANRSIKYFIQSSK